MEVDVYGGSEAPAAANICTCRDDAKLASCTPSFSVDKHVTEGSYSEHSYQNSCGCDINIIQAQDEVRDKAVDDVYAGQLTKAEPSKTPSLSTSQNTTRDTQVDSERQAPSSRGEFVHSNNAADAVEETRQPQGGRMPSDSVLKTLMQKVRALDLNLSVLERYLEVNSRYGTLFKEFDQDMESKDQLLEKIKLDVKSIIDSKEVIIKDVEDLVSWNSLASEQLNDLIEGNAILRFATYPLLL